MKIRITRKLLLGTFLLLVILCGRLLYTCDVKKQPREFISVLQGANAHPGLSAEVARCGLNSEVDWNSNAVRAFDAFKENYRKLRAISPTLAENELKSQLLRIKFSSGLSAEEKLVLAHMLLALRKLP